MASYHNLLLTVIGVTTALVSPLRAQVLDTFSGTATADAPNYTLFEHYPTSGGTTKATFAINSSSQFQPVSVSTNNTTEFFWNGGQTLQNDLGFGDSVSIDIDSVGNGPAVGLAFATSLGGANDTEIDLVGSAGTGTATAGGIANITGNTLTFNFALGPIVETITRTGSTTLSYTLSGAGLTSGPISGSITDAGAAGNNLYFGLSVYSGSTASGTAINAIEDNLTYNAAPEPSTYAMLLAGVAGLCFYLRYRKNSLFKS